MNFLNYLGFTSIQNLTASEITFIALVVVFVIVLIVGVCITSENIKIFGLKLYEYLKPKNNKIPFETVTINSSAVLSLLSDSWLSDTHAVHYIKNMFNNEESKHKIFKLVDRFDKVRFLIIKDKTYYYYQEFFNEEIDIADMYIDLTHDKSIVFPYKIDLVSQNIGFLKKNSQDCFVLKGTHTINNVLPNEGNTYIYAFYKAETVEGLFALKYIDCQTGICNISVGIIIDEVIFS